jgi:hypothetical protein
MTTENALKKYKEQLEALALDAYKDHRIKREGDRRWLIQRKTAKGWEGFHWTEIIIVTGGILVHGDGDTCLFKVYHPPKGEDDPIAAARWIAKAPDQYAQEKCNIGMDTSGVAGVNNTFDDEVAIWELQERVKERTSEITDEAGNIAEALKEDKELAAWRNALEAMQQGWEDWYFVKNTLYDDLCEADVGDESELISDIGIVPAPRLYYARAALRKFVELYDARKAATSDAA